GDGDGGGSTAPTVDLSGNYTAVSQPVEVSESGKYLRIDAPTEAPISMSVNLPTIGVSDFPGTCSHQGFADDAAAADFWNAHATEGGDNRSLRIQVDKKAPDVASTSHFTEVFWHSGELFIKMRNGNHTEYGAATWTGGNDSYTLTGGGLSLILPNTDTAVGCDAAVLGTSFTFDLTR
ncbi:MAG TPA: hypothetical protein VMO47_08040, partial [Rhodothermales bacterium]|nr:hypothetical protein [Rhodothermales bacterium]